MTPSPTPRPSRHGLLLLTAWLAAWLVTGALPAAAQGAGPTLEDLVEAARTAQAGSHFAAAAAAYRKATALEPSLAELWANRGLMEHLAAQPEAALLSFHHALALKPGLFSPLLFSGVDLVAVGRPAEALPFLDRALAAQPGNPDAVVASARANAALGQPRRAAAAWQQVTELQPGNPAAWYGLAVNALGTIEQDGETLAHRDAGSPWARALYADELLAQSRTREAIDLYRETAAQAPPETRAKLLAVLEAAAPDPAAGISTETLATLREALGPAGAPVPCPEASAQPATATQPGAETQADAACAYLAGDDTVSARAADKSPTPVVRSRDTHSAPRPSTADQRAAAKAPSPEALYWSVKSNERRAVLALARFRELAPQSPATADLAGDLLRRRAQPEQARAEYARALALDPHDPAALLGTAAAHLAEGHLDEAVAFARRGLAERPGDPKLNLLAGEALVAQHHFPEAQPYLQRSLRATAPSSTAPSSTASSTTAPSATASSTTASSPPYPFTESSTAPPSTESSTAPSSARARAHALLGRVAAERGDTTTAIAEMRLGLADDRDGSLHYQLFRLLRQTGDIAGAQRAEAEARTLQTQRLTHAVTAVQGSQEAPIH